MGNYPDNFSQEAFERRWGGVSEKPHPYDLEPLPRVKSTGEQAVFNAAIKEVEQRFATKRAGFYESPLGKVWVQ